MLRSVFGIGLRHGNVAWTRYPLSKAFTASSCTFETVQALLPEAQQPLLKRTLTTKQLAAAEVMLSRGVTPLPSHWFTSPTHGISLPRPGALTGHSQPLRKTGGRNHHGKITVRHIGGGFKRRIRLLDTQRYKTSGDVWRVERLEHDPNRSAKIALVRVLRSDPNVSNSSDDSGISSKDSTDAPKASHTPKMVKNTRTHCIRRPMPPEVPNAIESFRYILATEDMQPGSVIPDGPLSGATLALRNIPLGTNVHNIESRPGSGGKLVRAAGANAVLVGKDSAGHATVRLPSGASVRLALDCRASIGRVGNADWHHRVIGKAGRSRNLGIRPSVRGVAMNAVDHPHGGGKGGRGKGKPSQSIWGWVCK
jgi:large subunit ribosomal protein L2